MGGAVPPLPQYTFMPWCSVGRSTGTTLLLLLHANLFSFRPTVLKTEEDNKAQRLKERKSQGEVDLNSQG
jgi:hypothetical protein